MFSRDHYSEQDDSNEKSWEEKKNSWYEDWDRLTKNPEFISEWETKMEVHEERKEYHNVVHHRVDHLVDHHHVDHHAYMSWESWPSIEEACTPTFFITRRSDNSEG